MDEASTHPCKKEEFLTRRASSSYYKFGRRDTCVVPKNVFSNYHRRSYPPLPLRYRKCRWPLCRRLQQDSRLQPEVAPSRQIPQRADNVHGSWSWCVVFLLHLEDDRCSTRGVDHGGNTWKYLLVHRLECHPLSWVEGCGPRVWDRLPTGLGIYRACLRYMDWLVVRKFQPGFEDEVETVAGKAIPV